MEIKQPETGEILLQLKFPLPKFLKKKGLKNELDI